jgi:hypothetical protein
MDALDGKATQLFAAASVILGFTGLVLTHNGGVPRLDGTRVCEYCQTTGSRLAEPGHRSPLWTHINDLTPTTSGTGPMEARRLSRTWFYSAVATTAWFMNAGGRSVWIHLAG